VKNNEFLTTSELAKILGISRIAVYKKIKKGQIKAIKIGRNNVIPKKYIPSIAVKTLSAREKNIIDTAVRKTVNEYGETLRLLGKE
jgi:excisionase family DNA binding protein